ncbi:hypothetical protein [Nostoc sp. CHAB 5715]|uniref:hypothetical protein n=1 Tax=Nostoc sp. CHAB 5715 TaxID=2780400 RepID=UPI001E49F08E|nr:hypothetical protein [Nostoc sp. CHAB 5715]MCC5625148.1 hypothetical protein [Nostoc sp. CHAB 5715]
MGCDSLYPKDGLIEFITTAMREVAKRNPGLSGTLTLKDYNEKQSNQRVFDDDRLKDLIELISRHRLALKNRRCPCIKMILHNTKILVET